MSKALTYDKGNDFYKVLGVSHSEEDKKIKVAYYKLAQKYHPDKIDPSTSEAEKTKFEEKFKNISQAYDILKDEATRKQYDALRHQALHGP